MKTNTQVIAPEIKQAQKVAREVTAKMRRAHILAWAKQGRGHCRHCALSVSNQQTRNIMTIKLEREYGEFNCSTYFENVEVVLSTTYKGRPIYRDADRWYYVHDGIRYQYFDSLRAAKWFIDN